MRRFNILFLCFILLTGSFFAPVSYAAAADENFVSNEDLPEDAFSRSSFPKVLDSEIEFKSKRFFRWFGLRDVPDENIIEELIFTHVAQNLDYSLYNFVFDFEFKTKLDDGSVVTSYFTYTIEDITQYYGGSIDHLTRFEHVLDYRDILKNASDFKEYDVTGKGNYTYNTVISQIDSYFVLKEDGTKGDSRRFRFVWDENFKLQKCIGISFSWYRFPVGDNEEIEKDIFDVEDLSGLDGVSTNSDSYLGIDGDVLEDMFSLIIGIPSAIFTFLINLPLLVDSITSLLDVVFPFLPHNFFLVLCYLLIFIPCGWGVYKFIKGILVK